MGGKVKLLFKYGLLWCLSLGLVLLTLGTSSSVYAQEEDVDEFMLEEIVVTAEKREAELQKIPLEISVVRPEEMKRLNINQVYDLEKLLPDVSTASQVSTFIIVSIREVTTGQWNPMFETTVATHLDGIQLTRFGGMENHFFDLERVEVLKGPQGTLYGRGSTAGSMNIITQKPILGEFSGNAEIEFGNYSLTRATAAINIPLTDTLAMRVAGRNLKRDGYSDSGYSDADSRSGRLSLRWEPNERTTFTMVGDWEMFENNGYAMSVGGAPQGFYFNTYGDVEIVENDIEPNPSHWTKGGPVYSRWESKWVWGTGLDNNFNDNSNYGVTGILDYDLDFATLTAQFSHRSMWEDKNFMWVGCSMTPYPYIPGTFGTTYTGTYPVTQVTVRVTDPFLFVQTNTSSDTDGLEARLTSKTSIPAGDPFEWILGAIAQDDKVTEEVFTSPFYWVKISSLSSALFGQASWMPFEKWNFTGGGRLNWDQKDYEGVWTFPVTYPPPTYAPVIDRDFSLMQEASFSWSEPTYKLNLSFIPTDDIMAYLQYSKGYRTGNVDFQGRANTPEFLNAWELGFKSRWFDNRLQFNAGLYYYDYKNYNEWTNVSRCIGTQYADHTCEDVMTAPGPFDPPGTPATPGPDGIVDNWDEENLGYVGYSPGSAEQMGISVNFMWLITRNDTLMINGTWRHNEYGDDYNRRDALLAMFPDAVNVWGSSYADESGREFGGAPIRANGTYSHTFNFKDGSTLFANGTLFYNGDGIDIHVNYGEPGHYVMPGREAYWTGDLSATYMSSRWMPAGTMWNIRLMCNNVWDNDALDTVSYSDDIFFGPQNVYTPGSGLIVGNYILPRTYSVTFGINW
jgi:outer membrane receptor protein involved in Fe transport